MRLGHQEASFWKLNSLRKRIYPSKEERNKNTTLFLTRVIVRVPEAGKVEVVKLLGKSKLQKKLLGRTKLQKKLLGRSKLQKKLLKVEVCKTSLKARFELVLEVLGQGSWNLILVGFPLKLERF